MVILMTRKLTAFISGFHVAFGTFKRNLHYVLSTPTGIAIEGQ